MARTMPASRTSVRARLRVSRPTQATHADAKMSRIKAESPKGERITGEVENNDPGTRSYFKGKIKPRNDTGTPGGTTPKMSGTYGPKKSRVK